MFGYQWDVGISFGGGVTRLRQTTAKSTSMTPKSSIPSSQNSFETVIDWHDLQVEVLEWR